MTSTSTLQKFLFNVCAQELITELQDQESFGKRGEVWAFGELAAVLLLLIPPFTLTVGVRQALPAAQLELNAALVSKVLLGSWHMRTARECFNALCVCLYTTATCIRQAVSLATFPGRSDSASSRQPLHVLSRLCGVLPAGARGHSCHPSHHCWRCFHVKPTAAVLAPSGQLIAEVAACRILTMCCT